MENNNSLIISPENLTPVIQSAPAILTSNRERTENAKKAGLSLIEKMKEGINETLYKQGLEYIGKVKKTIEYINDQRKPITQLLSEVSKAFTTLEAELDEKRADTVPFKVQKALNDYAQEQLKIKQEQERQAALKLKMENAKIEIKADLAGKLNNYFYNLMALHINYMNKIWAEITLENFDQVTTAILNANAEFNESMLNAFKYELPYGSLVQLSEMLQIKDELIKTKSPEFKEIYSANYKSRKDQIELEFNSKFEELQRIANANAEEAKRLKAEAEERERKTQENLKKKQQEELERANMQEAVEKEAQKINTLFDVTAEVTAPAISMKATYELEIKNVAGWMSVISFWFENEGKSMTIEQLEKKFSFARKFAETQYNKKDQKINSPFLVYKQVAKAK